MLTFNPFDCSSSSNNSSKRQSTSRRSVKRDVVFIFKLKVTDISAATAAAEHNVVVPLNKLHQEERPDAAAAVTRALDAARRADAATDARRTPESTDQRRSKLWRHCLQSLLHNDMTA